MSRFVNIKMTLFPVKDEVGKMIDSFLLPVFVKISVRILKSFPSNFLYNITEALYFCIFPIKA